MRWKRASAPGPLSAAPETRDPVTGRSRSALGCVALAAFMAIFHLMASKSVPFHDVV
jgi:hypothetical protein